MDGLWALDLLEEGNVVVVGRSTSWRRVVLPTFFWMLARNPDVQTDQRVSICCMAHECVQSLLTCSRQTRSEPNDERARQAPRSTSDDSRWRRILT